jgi:hypothetical protein
VWPFECMTIVFVYSRQHIRVRVHCALLIRVHPSCNTLLGKPRPVASVRSAAPTAGTHHSARRGSQRARSKGTPLALVYQTGLPRAQCRGNTLGARRCHPQGLFFAFILTNVVVTPTCFRAFVP